MKHWISLIGAVIPLVVFAATGSPDEAFLTRITQSGLANVVVGKLAETKGSRESVRQFGAMVVKEDGAANEKLKTLARAKGIALPDEPDIKHTARAELFEQEVGPDFDRIYIDAQIRDHQETEAVLQSEIALGYDAEAKEFAQDILPKVQERLKTLETIKTGR